MQRFVAIFAAALLTIGSGASAIADDESFTWDFHVENMSKFPIVVKDVRGCPLSAMSAIVRPKGHFTLTCPLAGNAAGQLEIQRDGRSGSICGLRIVNLSGIYVNRLTVTGHPHCTGTLNGKDAVLTYSG